MIFPAAIRYQSELAKTCADLKAWSATRSTPIRSTRSPTWSRTSQDSTEL